MVYRSGSRSRGFLLRKTTPRDPNQATAIAKLLKATFPQSRLFELPSPRL
jgi:hypothetical protein